MDPLCVTVNEAGRLIGGSRNTVYRLMASGILRAVKRGTTTLVLMDSIHEHVASLPAVVLSPSLITHGGKRS